MNTSLKRDASHHKSPFTLTVASRTAAKPRYQNLANTSTIATYGEEDVTLTQLTDINGSDSTLEAIFPLLPSLQRTGTPALSLFHRDEVIDPTTDTALSSAPSTCFWQYQRFGSVSHTALGLAPSPVATSRLTSLSQESGCSADIPCVPFANDNDLHRASSSSSSSSPLSPSRESKLFHNGHSGPPGACDDSAQWKGQFRTGRACSRAGLSGLLEPSILLRSAWVS
ncbi:hypothetical protein PoB_003984700 [Plakobranchus ocellatus]|uniref:Uncharacterized protein n=1 Tax=Plakobranchus ocellatus TaxID=259542 RepID=A0AAV4B1D1_9GAST|nr:hypothetical protein PoB_003984700 [Plakobranchus ocellatus]